jgi:signal transduction histidine kinase
VGKSSHDLFPTEIAERYNRMDHSLLVEGGEIVFETTLLYKDGETHDVILNKGVFTNAEGAVSGIVGVSVDITERKRAEQALQKAHDELELRVQERTEELARANEDLRNEISERRRAEEAVRQSAEKLKLFAFSIAHDLKSPATAIYGLTRLLGTHYSEHLDDRGKAFCSNIMKAAEHVVSLAEKISMFAATREAPVNLEAIDLAEVVRGIHDEFAQRLSDRSVEWREPELLPRIRADRVALLRALRNFVDNALKYGGEKLRHIRLGYRETPDHHILSVTDDGKGIGGHDFERIFEAFQRRDAARVEGAGLGLAIVREIAEQHGGRAWAEPRAGGGCSFSISIAKRL